MHVFVLSLYTADLLLMQVDRTSMMLDINMKSFFPVPKKVGVVRRCSSKMKPFLILRHSH